MTNRYHDLKSIDLSTAHKLYLNHKKTYCSEAAVQAYHYQTKHIINYSFN